MALNKNDPLDPRGLIAEAFRIEGVVEADCRSIFFDWALGLEPGQDPAAAIEGLLARHAAAPGEHPMRQVLLEGLNRRDGVTAREGGRRTGRRRTVERPVWAEPDE